MQIWKRAGAIALLIATIVSMRWYIHSHADAPTAPRDFDDVIAIAKKLGLHWRGGREDGNLMGETRLVLSTKPLTWDRVNSLGLHAGKETAWRDTVGVYIPNGSLNLFDGMEVWGDLVICGDETLIKKLRETRADE